MSKANQEPVADSAPSAGSNLSHAELRQLFAKIVRVNVLDCFDASGAFDVERAQRVLPAGAVQQLSIQETTRIDRQGNPVVKRNIRVQLANRLQAVRLNEFLLRQEQEECAESRCQGLKKKLGTLEKASLRQRCKAADARLRQNRNEAELRSMEAQAEANPEIAERLRMDECVRNSRPLPMTNRRRAKEDEAMRQRIQSLKETMAQVRNELEYRAERARDHRIYAARFLAAGCAGFKIYANGILLPEDRLVAGSGEPPATLLPPSVIATASYIPPPDCAPDARPPPHVNLCAAA